MAELDFRVAGASILQPAAVPTLAFRLAIASRGPEPIQSLLLDCQVQIEATRRRYGAAEQHRLRDLFGPPELWSRSLTRLFWTHATLVVPGFTGHTEATLKLPCSFDFNVAATKYFAAQDGGEIPIGLLFSGSVFYRAENGMLQTNRISWEKEAAWALPAGLWKELMDRYYPGEAWLCLGRDVFDRLRDFRVQAGLPSFEAALERLLPEPAPGEVRR